MTEIVDLFGEYDGHRVRGEQLVRHAGSLVGKDFRWAVQVMPLALRWLTRFDPSVPLAVTTVWVIAAELTRMLYYPRVPLSHLQQWVQKLRDLVYRYISITQQLETGNLLDFDANQAPAGQASAAAASRPRLKDYLLLHIPDLVEYWGPLVLWQTERFKSANGDIRAAISHTNPGGATWMLNGARVAAQSSVENSFSGSQQEPNRVIRKKTAVRSSRGQVLAVGNWAVLLRGDEDVIVELVNFREEAENVNVLCREWVKQDSWDLLGYVHLVRTDVVEDVPPARLLEREDVWHDCHSQG
ncbi:hypothetical protein RI367_002627 [Sorochytrium milnesiophthora]